MIRTVTTKPGEVIAFETIFEENLAFEGEIDCRDLFFNEDDREKILVFSVEA